MTSPQRLTFFCLHACPKHLFCNQKILNLLCDHDVEILASATFGRCQLFWHGDLSIFHPPPLSLSFCFDSQECPVSESAYEHFGCSSPQFGQRESIYAGIEGIH